MIYFVSLLAFGFTLLWLPPVLELLRQSGMVRPNYLGKKIPVPSGLALLTGLVSALAVTAVFFPPDRLVLISLTGMAAMAFLGLLDDVLGSREASGLRGHFRLLFRQRRLTTGACKALGGGLVALFLSACLVNAGQGVASQGIASITRLSGHALLPYLFDLAGNTLIIALSANAVNLLDLRPGRAIKGYLTTAVVILFLAGSPAAAGVTVPVMAAAAACLPSDVRGRAMLGDTGANLLGLSLGLAAAAGLPPGLRAGYFGFLVLFHIYTEKYSLTRTIERVGVLRFLDQLGRPVPAQGSKDDDPE